MLNDIWLFFYDDLISNCRFRVPRVWEIWVRKNLTILEGCHFPRFYILIWSSFRKMETQNFDSDQCFLNLVKLGMILPSLLNYVLFVPTCLTCLMCLCALRAYVPSFLKLLLAYMPSWLKLRRVYVPTCLKLLHAYVPTCLKLLRA